MAKSTLRIPGSPLLSSRTSRPSRLKFSALDDSGCHAPRFSITLLRMNIAIIGGGPAGLRAAEIAAAGGATIALYDAKPSVGRKFLVAGRGGLNLTNSESRPEFSTRYIATGAGVEKSPRSR